MTPFAKNAVVLGLLAALGPFAIDMYLPALPTIASDLKASAALTQDTLLAYFLSMGLCQLAYGPWSDIAGRKLPLYLGLVLLSMGSIGCGLAPSVGWLIAFRALQGIGAASTMVIPRAIVRDLHTGPEATKLMALIMLVIAVSPIIAPVLGSGMIMVLGWRSVFAAMAVLALAGLALITTALPETRLPQHRGEASLKAVVEAFRVPLADARFMGLTCVGGFGMASFLVFVANSSFIYMDQFGLSPTQYSLAFSINAVAFIVGAQCASRLVNRFGASRTIMAVAIAFVGFAVALFGAVALGADSLAVLIGFLLCAFACLGAIIPTTTVLSLEEVGAVAGVASALSGMLQMAIGASVMALGTAVFDGSSLPMVALIALCALATLVTSSATLTQTPRSPEDVSSDGRARSIRRYRSRG